MQFSCLVLLLFIVDAIPSRKDRYEKLRGVVQLRKQATINQMRRQERQCEEFQRQILKEMGVQIVQRNVLLEEWKIKRVKVESVRQMETHVQTMMSLLKHNMGFRINDEYFESMNFHQRQLESLSGVLGLQNEIGLLKYQQKPSNEQVIETHHQLQRVMNLLQPMEKEQELLRLDYSQKMIRFQNELKNLQDQLDLNIEAVEWDQYELEKDILLHYHELELLDNELLKMNQKQ